MALEPNGEGVSSKHTVSPEYIVPSESWARMVQQGDRRCSNFLWVRNLVLLPDVNVSWGYVTSIRWRRWSYSGYDATMPKLIMMKSCILIILKESRLCLNGRKRKGKKLDYFRARHCQKAGTFAWQCKSFPELADDILRWEQRRKFPRSLNAYLTSSSRKNNLTGGGKSRLF